MAEGYVNVAHSTYDEWRANTIGRAFDLDGSFGCQCWDYASLFWRNVGFPVLYPQTGPLLYAYQCWTVSRVQNSAYNGVVYFDLIEGQAMIKRGDVLVFNGTSANPPGHITFADEDYDGSGYIWCVGQNQGGTPDPSGGTAVTRNHLSIFQFLGAFRYKEWHTTPQPTVTFKPVKKRFPWCIYARKFRNQRQGM